MKRYTAMALLLLLAGVPCAQAETLVIIGVVVKGGERLAGASVKLYGTQNKTGSPLASDTASDRGVFNLYRTNIAGDLGDLFIVYEGSDGAAQPLKVSARSATDGLIEIRTPDVVVKPIQNAGVLTPDQAAETIAAITSTESVLVEAGVKDAAQARVSGEAKARIVLARVPKMDLQRNNLQGLTELRIPKKDMHGFTLDPRTFATETIQKVTPKGPGGGG